MLLDKNSGCIATNASGTITPMSPENTQTEHSVYQLFKWSILLKGVISVGEVFAGIVLLLIPSAYIIALVQGLGTWLSGYADSTLTLKLVTELSAFGAGSALFVALYLLSRGLIKCALILGLLKNKLWAYPASLVVLGLFLIYQAYEIFIRGSVFVIAISLFDIIVMYLIWREWSIVRRHGGARPS